MATREFRLLLAGSVGGPILEGATLDRFSSFKIGGPADLLFEARTEDELRSAVVLAVREHFPFYVIGGGTNVLFDDEGYRGLVVRNKVEEISWAEGRVTVSSGTALSTLLQRALTRGLAGFEFLAGIPGTVGGAMFSNAGAFGACIGDRLEEAAALGPAGVETRLTPRELAFGYRRSSLQKDHVMVLRAVLRAEPGDRKASEEKVREYMEKRRTRHPPWGTACAGSFFKNPCSPDGQRIPAGRLLEQAGARGMSVGGAAVYEGHCNFIINTGNARARDVIILARELKERVFETSGVRLEEEVVYLPATGSML
ncbi:MAG TPA: UDP-N-acetylmuramate dehydrogenase [Burkholderiales bacterium]|nr:UDP-N-acetylmuramate dehydrogenase [Burkholderiales bacterium]